MSSTIIQLTKAINVICVTLFSLALVILSSGLINAQQQKTNPSVSNSDHVGLNKGVEVGVYYESLCPDSKRFFLTQLIPAYKDVGSIMNLTLIPFGHARVIGQGKMVCQHGQRECDYNRLMACIQDRAKRSGDEGAMLATLGCIFANRDKVKECLKDNLPKLNYADIDKCRTGEESFKMMQNFEQLTGRTGYIPKLTLNSLYSEDIQNELENNLKNTVCKNYSGQKPEKCNQIEKLEAPH